MAFPFHLLLAHCKGEVVVNLLCISSVYRAVTQADVVRAYPTGQDITKLPRTLWTTYIRLGRADVQNAIERAVKHAHLDAIKLLLSSCPDATYATLLSKVGPLECVGDDGELELLNSPLAHASRLGNLETIKFLVSIGADANDDPYAFSDACSSGHLHVVEFFVRIGIKDCRRRWSFLYACFEGHLDVIQYLVMQGWQVESECIGWAIKGGSLSTRREQSEYLHIIKYLISVGDALDFDNILKDAIRDEADLEIIKYLRCRS